ncbi:MAG: hypothetical protein V2I33_17935, partial [Kangiellaceae bacterium]|nr:hypothetical protein [Kangiellaceae bacterium]
MPLTPQKKRAQQKAAYQRYAAKRREEDEEAYKEEMRLSKRMSRARLRDAGEVETDYHRSLSPTMRRSEAARVREDKKKKEEIARLRVRVESLERGQKRMQQQVRRRSSKDSVNAGDFSVGDRHVVEALVSTKRRRSTQQFIRQVVEEAPGEIRDHVIRSVGGSWRLSVPSPSKKEKRLPEVIESFLTATHERRLVE